MDRATIKILRKVLSKRSRIHLEKFADPMAILAFDFIGNEITINGVYELPELKQLFYVLDEFEQQFKLGTACDIGANIGNHSRYFAGKFKKVVAFEPNPLIVEILKFNTKSFSNVSILECAVGNFQGTSPIFGTQTNIGGFSVLQNRISVNEQTPSNQYPSNAIQVITLDSMIDDLGNLEFIKIDVEGFETQVIEGAAQSIRKFKPVIAFEQWPKDFINSHSSAIELLTEMGYLFYRQSDYSSSANAISKMLQKLWQTSLGIKRVYFNLTQEVPPGHYSMLIAVHKSNNKVSAVVSQKNEGQMSS